MDTQCIDAGFGVTLMILKGSQRSGATALADHLMNEQDNDHVSVMELRSFVADDLHGSLSEAHAISKATKCKQFMFSLSLNPPQDYVATEDDFREAADRAEQSLGLDGQPRAIVIHEKEGRRHAHVVWSRIDTDCMKAINLPHFKNKLRDLSRDLFLDHGWVLPDGLATYGNKNPLNFTLEEWQQAKRQNLDPREIKQAFRQAWERSDSLDGLKNALEDRGYFLARGDRRGVVALDIDGNVYSFARWSGVRAKDVKSRLGALDHLASVDETHRHVRSKVTDQLRSYITEVKASHVRAFDPLRDRRREMKQAHCRERQKMKDGQEKRWVAETKRRSERLNKGLRGMFDKLTGKAKAIQKINEVDARTCALRDQQQRDFMITAQLRERQELQRDVIKLWQKHKQDRRILAQSIKQTLQTQNPHTVSRPRNRDNSLTI